MVLQEAVGRGWRAGVSLQTSWLQEFTNQVSSPRTTASGLVGPRPLHEKSQWETAHYCLAPQRAEGRCGCGPGLSVPGALAPKSMDVVPSQPYPPKSNQEHFLRVSVIFLGGVPVWREETPASRVKFFEGKLFAHLGPFLRLFYQFLGCQRLQGLGPSTFELLTQPGRPLLPGSASPDHDHTAPASSRHQEGLHGALRPGLERNSLHHFSAFFPLQEPLGPSRRPHRSGDIGHPHCAPRGALGCANPHKTLVL